MAELFAAGGIEVAVEELEAVGLSIGTACGAKRLAFGVGGGADDAGAKRSGGGKGGGAEDEEGVGEVAEIAVEGGIQDLERLGEFPGADVVAGAVEGAGEGVGAGGEDVEAEVGEGEGAQVAHVVAGIVDERFADDEASVGGEGAGGAGEEGAPEVGRKLIEDVMEEDDIEFSGGDGELLEGGGIGAEDGVGPAGLAERGEAVVEAAEGGAGAVADGEGDGAPAQVVEEGPRGGAGAAAEVENAQGLAGFGEGREFGEDKGEAGIGLGGEETRVGGAGAGIAAMVRGGGIGAGDGEAVGEASDVRHHAMEDIADGSAVGFGLGDLEPVCFEFSGVGEGGHGSLWGRVQGSWVRKC